MQFLRTIFFFIMILCGHIVLPSQVVEWYKKGQEVTSKVGPDATYKDYFDLYVNDWKKVVHQLDWEKLKWYLQEEMGMSRAGEIAQLTPLPAIIKDKPTISAAEQYVVGGRQQIRDGAFHHFTHLRNSHDVTVAVSCAGSGYTGMIAAASFLEALESQGLMDIFSYSAASSGATWAVGAVNLLQSTRGPNFTYANFKEMLLQKVKAGTFNYFGLENFAQAKSEHVRQFSLFLRNALWPKMVFGQVVSSVDFLGYLLAQFLFEDFGDQKYDQYLSSIDHVLNSAPGSCPWPLFTAISMQKDEQSNASYHVYEFNPKEVRNLSLNIGFEQFGFDKKFKNGSTFYAATAADRLIASRDIAPEESIGFMLGMFGSKHAASWEDIKHMLLGAQSAQEIVASSFGQVGTMLSWDNATALLRSVKKGLQGESKEMVSNQINKIQSAFLVKAIESVGVFNNPITIGQNKFVVGGTMRISPAQIHNPFYQYPSVSAWLRMREYLTFVDASFFYDVPLLPLLSPERKVDLVLVCDPYADTLHMDAAFAHVQQLKNVSYVSTGSGAGWQIYKPTVSKAGVEQIQQFPVIVRLYPTGDAISKIQGARKLNPIDFSYSLEQFTALDEGCQQAVQTGLPIIQKELRELVHERTKHTVAGIGQ
ncbi:MAG: hypothetical protein WCE21_01115 [Candidatus Babeliales bacterium]